MTTPRSQAGEHVGCLFSSGAEPSVGQRAQMPSVSLGTRHPNKALAASTHSSAPGARRENESAVRGRGPTGSNLGVQKGELLSGAPPPFTLLSAEPRRRLQSQKLPLVSGLRLEPVKPDESQDGGPHFPARLIHGTEGGGGGGATIRTSPCEDETSAGVLPVLCFSEISLMGYDDALEDILANGPFRCPSVSRERNCF